MDADCDYGHGNAGSVLRVAYTPTVAFERAAPAETPLVFYGPVRRKRTVLPDAGGPQGAPGNRYRDRDTLRHAAEAKRRAEKALNGTPDRTVKVRAIVADASRVPLATAARSNVAPARGERVTVPGTGMVGLLARLDAATTRAERRAAETAIRDLERDLLCGRNVPGRNG